MQFPHRQAQRFNGPEPSTVPDICIVAMLIDAYLVRVQRATNTIMSSDFSPTPPELAVVSQIFSHADPQRTGILTGDVAVRVFSGARLPSTTLETIWTISDEDNEGWLSKRGVAIAVRLIGWAQKGENINKDLVKKRNSALTSLIKLFASLCYFY